MAKIIQKYEGVELLPNSLITILDQYRLAVVRYREMSWESKERAKGRRPKGRTVQEYRADMIRAETELSTMDKIVRKCFSYEQFTQIQAELNPEGFVA